MASELPKPRPSDGRAARKPNLIEDLDEKFSKSSAKLGNTHSAALHQSVPVGPPTAPVPVEQLDQMTASLGEILEMVSAVREQQTTGDRAFDQLYEELGEYKNDFFYERLKPMARQLLFLLDSIEQFDYEIDEHTSKELPISTELVKANLNHFKDQLVDALQTTGLAAMELQSDEFDPKTQRAVEVVVVPPENHNRVQRVVRGAWTIGDKLLRPADVVVGRTS